MQVFLVFMAVLLFVNCKAHQRAGKEPHSEPNFVQSNDGTILTLTLGKEGKGYCVLKTNENDLENYQLLTTNGGLDKKQLGEAFRFMGFLGNFVLPAVTSVTSWLALHVLWMQGQRKWEKLDLASGNRAMLKAGIAGVAIMGVYHGGKIAYRVVKAKEEGQGTKEQVISGVQSGFILGPLVELVRRKERVEEALSDKVALKFSNKKMHEIVIKITDMKGKFPHSCDHL